MLLNSASTTRASFIFFFVCSLFISGCSDSSTNKPGRKPSEHLVETILSNYENISVRQTIPGTLQAIREVRIINQAQGLLIKLPVYPGDIVKTGQTLAQLDDTLIKAEVQKAQATLKQAKVDLRRLNDLAPRKLASESDIAQAQTVKDIAASDLHLKQTELKHTRLQAPIEGIISERLVEPGDVIPLHSHLLSIIDTSRLKAEIHLSELLLPLIETGNQVDISIDALGEQLYAGKIQRIYPAIDKNTRKGTIEITLSPVPPAARAGQLCRVTIHTQNKTRLMIPYDTVRYDKYGAYVYTLKEDHVKRVNITTGIQHNQQIEVLDGLVDQQEIISKGFFGLKDKKKVKKVILQSPAKDLSAEPGKK